MYHYNSHKKKRLFLNLFPKFINISYIICYNNQFFKLNSNNKVKLIKTRYN
jgi:hypothetical protein